MEYPFPRRFYRLHVNQLTAGYPKYGEYMYIAPREPLGPPIPHEGAASCEEKIVVVKVRRVIGPRGMVASAATQADQKAAEEWEERHRDTADEEFI